jgi:xanthosine utilization system XapX-like protein
MPSRPLLVAAGAGLTVGLVVAVLVIEAVPVELSALVGLRAGIIAGLLVAAWS